ncbi:hypothetical protein DL96DRAFT_1034079 [Flagelloscypha sp. PMI_526]|nr:hypothetical protein DL96DRAFT_1034079 [Flagelloscypha sp. PMI_526]
MSLTPFRTISRQRSSHTLNSNNLSSPSVISLNSISLPLRETLVKSDFVYPSSGPTPEQVKLISSRESFSRFGKPYGADAIAYAASRSRIEFMGAPPEFEDASFDTGLPRTSSVEVSEESHADLRITPSEHPAVPPSPAPPTADPAPPPTSFRMPVEPLGRSESRASTMTGVSFRTAQEGDDDDEDQNIHSHNIEATDATVRPHPASPSPAS